MTFTKTVGGCNPWSMPSDGTDFVCITRQTKNWERRQYAKASRREGKMIVKEWMEEDCDEDV